MYNNPQLIANALNTKPVISFDGSTNYGSFPISLGDNTSRTIFIVGKYNNINRGQEGFIALGFSGNWDLGYVFRDNASQQTNYYVNYENAVQAAAPQSTSVANYHIAIINHSLGSDSNMGINGVFGDNATLDLTSINEGLIAVRNTNPDEYASINIAEIIIYNRALTTPERQKVEAYLNTKYAIYNPIPNNKISIKKQNLGSGKISLFFDTLPLNTQRIRLNLGFELGGCGNDFVLMQNGVWSQNGCDFYVRWDNKNGTLPYKWRFFYSSDGRTERASHPTAGPDALPKKGWSNGMTISENQLITFGQSLVVNNFQSDPDGNCDFSSLNGTWIYLGAPSFKYRSINAQIYYINTPLTPGEYGGNGLYQIQDSDEVYFTNSYSNSDKFPSNNWRPAAYIINNCPQITTTPVFSLL
jgi:hypothetical protein